MTQAFILSTCQFSKQSSSFGKASTQDQSQIRLRRWFILLLSQAAVLPRPDADSDVVEPASGFVTKTCQTSCSIWCPMYGARY